MKRVKMVLSGWAAVMEIMLGRTRSSQGIFHSVTDGDPAKEGWWFGHSNGGVSVRANITGPIGILPPTVITNTPFALAGYEIDITGTNFSLIRRDRNQVFFQGTRLDLPDVPAMAVNPLTASRCRTVSPGANGGPLRVSIGGVSGQGGYFKPQPTVGSFTPGGGGRGPLLNIYGYNLRPASGLSSDVLVQFTGAAPVPAAFVVDAGRIGVNVPVDAQTGVISVTVNGLTGVSGQVFWLSQFIIDDVEFNQGLPDYDMVAAKDTLVTVFAQSNIITYPIEIDSLTMVITKPNGTTQSLGGQLDHNRVIARNGITYTNVFPEFLVPGSSLVTPGQYQFRFTFRNNNRLVGTVTRNANFWKTDSIGLLGFFLGERDEGDWDDDDVRRRNAGLDTVARGYPVASRVHFGYTLGSVRDGVRFYDDGEGSAPCFVDADDCYTIDGGQSVLVYVFNLIPRLLAHETTNGILGMSAHTGRGVCTRLAVGFQRRLGAWHTAAGDHQRRAREPIRTDPGAGDRPYLLDGRASLAKLLQLGRRH